ncbi:MAG TPA: long-chain fatty acid--CoA ligase [Myxococcales bacterium]|jgi:long-chain acyl-CoA synthetase
MDRPWPKHYDPGVPERVEHRAVGLHELLASSAGRFPNHAALVLAVHAAGRVFTSRMSYAALAAQVDRCAASLQRLGVGKGDRVAIYLPNCPQFVVAYCAALQAGAIVVPFNTLYSPREVEYQLSDCGAKVMIALDRFYPNVQKVRARTKLERVVVTSVKEHFPALVKLLYWAKQGRKEEVGSLDARDLRWSTLVAPGAPPAPVASAESETAVLLYTGGTTGVSKGVELTHRNLVYNAEMNCAWARMEDGCHVTLGALPLFHAFGLTCGLNLSLLTAGTLVLVPNPTDLPGLAKTMQLMQPTVFPVVPRMLVGLSSLPGLERLKLDSVKVCPCAGSALAPAVQRTFEEKARFRVMEGYGLTECAPVAMGNPVYGENRSGTIGVPYPDTEARIVDVETGTRELPFEAGGEWTEPGEIVVRGPQVMKGYWNAPDATANQLKHGWLHTGDIGQMHRDGYFRIVDRLKDLIIRSGMKIYPAEIEKVLAEHPQVREALVVGMPDPTRGELVKAFVVAKPDVAPPTEEELLAFCRENLAKFKVPSAIEFRLSLPSSAVGKPLRRMLREERAA